jgi:hypothetical protein
MTLTSLIILNATLAAIVVYGILWLLGHGIRADQIASGLARDERHIATEERGRLAA